jgi:prolyl-tRNA synthetase
MRSLNELGIKKEELKEAKAIEVGNIFPLGTRFSEALNLKYKNEEGKKQSRYIWAPTASAPRADGHYCRTAFRRQGLGVARGGGAVSRASGRAFKRQQRCASSEAEGALRAAHRAPALRCLWDDRDARAGEKFADSDLSASRARVCPEKTLAAGKFECVERATARRRTARSHELMKDASP